MDNDETDYNEYDDKVKDIDEVEGTDIKINPDYYIHKALIKAQEALIKDNIKEGFLQYRQCVEYIEVLCNSANMLTDGYREAIKKFIEDEDAKNVTSQDEILAKSVRIANKKLGLMLSEVFAYKTATFNLKA